MHSNYTKTSRNQVIQLVLVPSVVKIRLIFIKKDQYFYSGFTQSLNQKCFLDFLLLMLQIMFLVFLDSNFKDEPSIRILKTCSDCTATKIIILLVLRIYREKIMSEGVKLPEQAVVEQIENVRFADLQDEMEFYLSNIHFDIMCSLNQIFEFLITAVFKNN